MYNLVFMLESRGIGFNTVRTIFTSLDRAAFWAFKTATQAIFDLTDVNIFSNGQYNKFMDRIYALIGVFMLFKVIITLLGYLVNPEKIADKNEGLSKIIGRIIVSICMLAGLPFLWNLIFGENVVNDKSLTEIMVESVPRLIIGRQSNKDGIKEVSGTAAENLAWTTYNIVFHNKDGSMITDCGGEVCTIKWAVDNVNNAGETNDVYKYDYIPFLGMVIGIVMAFIMIGIAIDVAIRIFKLFILRMIAPIPIISYILPKSTKDGGTFNNWVKTLISTWADLFIKLGIIYFVLYMIDELVLSHNPITGADVTGFRYIAIMTFVIIGLLFFARQAPKFITDLLGIKNSKGSVGLGGVLAGAGALIGGAGLTGAAMAGVTAMNENADAIAQGKGGTAGLSRGRDIAAQLRTGDKNAKGGLTNQLQSRLQLGSANRTANRLGLSAQNVAALKKNMYDREGELTDAQNALQQYHSSVDSGKVAYSKETEQALMNNIKTANKNYQKAQSAYNDAKSGRETIVPKNGTRDDYGHAFGSREHGIGYTATHRTNRANKEGDSLKAVHVDEVEYKDLNSVSIPSTVSSSSGSSAGGPGSSGNVDSYDDDNILDMMADAQNAAQDEIDDRRYSNGDFGDNNDIYMNGGFTDNSNTNNDDSYDYFDSQRDDN